MATYRLVLKPHTTYSEVDYMALDYFWTVYAVQEKTATAPFYKVWLEGQGDSQTVIMYTADDPIAQRYISVQGGNTEDVVGRIRASLDVYSEDEIKTAFARAESGRDWIAALTLLGASQSETFQGWAWDLFEKGLDHANPRVQLAAIAAAGHPAWPKFIDRLRPLINHSDGRVRVRAMRMLDLLLQKHKTAEQSTPST